MGRGGQSAQATAQQLLYGQRRPSGKPGPAAARYAGKSMRRQWKRKSSRSDAEYLALADTVHPNWPYGQHKVDFNSYYIEPDYEQLRLIIDGPLIPRPNAAPIQYHLAIAPRDQAFVVVQVFTGDAGEKPMVAPVIDQPANNLNAAIKNFNRLHTSGFDIDYENALQVGYRKLTRLGFHQAFVDRP